ncbi:MAG: hypothetical protein LQ339_006390 [Xanthoria mediterranea]|nr:MAG: hypothetical protein LQ339_006390 [Xanthoria mediterranea]
MAPTPLSASTAFEHLSLLATRDVSNQTVVTHKVVIFGILGLLEFSKRNQDDTIQYNTVSIMPTATPAPLPLVSQLKNDKRILIYIVLGLGGTLLLIVIAFFWHRHRKHQRARRELA